MHPSDQTNTVLGDVGLLRHSVDFFGAFDDGFEDHFDGQFARSVERFCDLFTVSFHLLEGFGTIKVLAADHKPNFEGIKN